MSVRLQDDVVHLEGECRVEDAERLAGLLHDQPNLTADLSACTSLHSAVLQVLLAFGVGAAEAPSDAFLATWIAPIMARQSVARRQ